MSYPVTPSVDGIKIKPEIMEPEVLYHCLFGDKLMLVYKDHNEVLNCFEIEEKKIIDQVKSGNIDVEKILEDYIKKENLKS